MEFQRETDSHPVVYLEYCVGFAAFCQGSDMGLIYRRSTEKAAEAAFVYQADGGSDCSPPHCFGLDGECGWNPEPGTVHFLYGNQRESAGDLLQSDDSVERRAEEGQEFVVNVVPEEVGERMNACSGEYPPEVDEFAISGGGPTKA